MDVRTATSSTSDHVDMLTIQVAASDVSDDGSADCELVLLCLCKSPNEAAVSVTG